MRIGPQSDQMQFSYRDGRLDCGGRTLIMGVVNVTPDSFSDGGAFFDHERAIAHGLELARQGADILDIGGESTRPGADEVPADEELARVRPVIEALAERTQVAISIDTRKAAVARRALAAGASIVNDVSALVDAEMAAAVAEAGAGVVLMHMRGTPEKMQQRPAYDDCVGEVSRALGEALARARDAGIPEGRTMIDPGIGFGKTLDHNLELLRGIPRLRELGRPVLVGTSRKSMIGMLTGRAVEDRLLGTAATVAVSAAFGADAVRVHDVAEMREVLAVADAIARGRGSAPTARSKQERI